MIGVTALAFAAAGGGAYAATTQSSTNPRQAFLSDVAKRLHVSPQRLTAAVKAALVDQVNAAVKAGRLSQAQGNAIKEQITKSGALPFPFPFLGPPGFRGPHVFLPPPLLFGGHAGPLAGAAGYLGLSDAHLFNELRSGRSLAQIAKAKGKSAAGLERAMTAAIKSGLERAVSAGRLSKSEAQQLLSRLTSHVHDLIYGSGLPRPQAGPPLMTPPVGPWPQHLRGSVPTAPGL